MIGPHFYKHLDKDDKIEIKLDLSDLARMVNDMNYGTQRFLSHLLDVRREALKAVIEEYQQRSLPDIAENVRLEGDPLADGIEALLKQGLY